MLQTHEIRTLVIDRRNACGVGLCGSCASITRWLNEEHGILTTESWVADVIATDQEPDKEGGDV